jgi:hypothetical protein
MTRLLATPFTTVTLLASVSPARSFAHSAPIGLAHASFVRRGFAGQPSFIPHSDFVGTRAFPRRFSVGPGITMTRYPAYRPYPLYITPH